MLDDDVKEPITKLTEFKDFKKFNQKSYGLASHVKNATDSNSEAVAMARKFYDKNTLNSYIKAGSLKDEQMDLLGTKTSEVKFSMDSIIYIIVAAYPCNPTLIYVRSTLPRSFCYTGQQTLVSHLT